MAANNAPATSENARPAIHSPDPRRPSTLAGVTLTSRPAGATPRAATLPALLTALAVLGLLLVTGTGSALAAGRAAGQAPGPYTGATPTCSVSSSTITEGQSVTLSCAGFDPGSTVAVTDNGAAVTTATADPSGAFSVTVTPAGTGQHTLTGTEQGSPKTASATVQVQAAGGTAPRGLTSSAGSSVVSGQSTTISGCGYKSGSTVTVTDSADGSSRTAPVGSDGCFSLTYTLKVLGVHVFRVTGVDPSGAALVRDITVSVSAASPLAFTGSNVILPGLVVGAGLLAVGSVLVVATRRRRGGAATA